MKREITSFIALVALTAPFARSPTAAQAHDLVATAANRQEFSTLTAALRAAGLTNTLQSEGPFTVFAPTNAAFAKIPPKTLQALLRPENRDKLKAILTYHVLPTEVLGANVSRLKDGAKVGTVNGAKVTLRNRLSLKVDDASIIRTDILTENGVIHAIDTVLIPPGLDLDTLSVTAETDLVDTAVRAGSFTTLVTAVKAAGLADTLKSAGPFTIFAPTDEAFAKLPAGTVNALLRPENRDKLKAILTYHVLPKQVLAERIQRLGSQVGVSKTVNGPEVRLRNVGKSIKVDDANVIKADIRTSNGVIHVIDTVLMPPGMSLD